MTGSHFFEGDWCQLFVAIEPFMKQLSRNVTSFARQRSFRANRLLRNRQRDLPRTKQLDDPLYIRRLAGHQLLDQHFRPAPITSPATTVTIHHFSQLQFHFHVFPASLLVRLRLGSLTGAAVFFFVIVLGHRAAQGALRILTLRPQALRRQRTSRTGRRLETMQGSRVPLVPLAVARRLFGLPLNEAR